LLCSIIDEAGQSVYTDLNKHEGVVEMERDCIIADSGTDFSDNSESPESPETSDNYKRVPFRITVDGIEFLDFKLDIKNLLYAMKCRHDKVLTACPPPAEFLTSFTQKANNFVVTLSSKLSGAYNSALIAKEMFMEDIQKIGVIHVFDSKSASAGETLVALKIDELSGLGIPFSDIVSEVTEYITKLRTFFVINSLDNLVKNGRLSIRDGIIGSVFHVTPIMGDNGDGEIELKGKAVGWKAAVRKLVDMIGSYDIDFKNSIMAISHVNAFEKALALKNDIMARYSFKNILIFKASGVSSAYADENGIILAFATK